MVQITIHVSRIQSLLVLIFSWDLLTVRKIQNVSAFKRPAKSPMYISICALMSEWVWKHLPLGAHALVRCYIDCVCDGLVADCQAEVSYGTHAVLLNQDIFRLEVTVSNAGLTCRRTDDTSLHLHQELSRDSACLPNVNDCCVRVHAPAVYICLFIVFIACCALMRQVVSPWVPRISMCRCARPLAADSASLIMPSMVTE